MTTTELKFQWHPATNTDQRIARDSGYDLWVFPYTGTYGYQVKYKGIEIAMSTKPNMDLAKSEAERVANTDKRQRENGIK